MRKFFFLIAAAFIAASTSAKEVILWEGEVVVNGWGDQPYVLSDAGSELKNAGASVGDFVRFYIESANAGWQLEILEGHWGPSYGFFADTALTNDDGSPKGNTVVDLSQTPYVELELTQAMLDAAYTQKYWGGVFVLNGDGQIKVNKVTLRTALDWETEAKVISYNNDGFIAASEFEGLDDNAQVHFTYKVEGTLQNPDGDGWQNWGIGRVCSSDESVIVIDIKATKLGESTSGCFYKDIKKALEVTPDGILFKFWDFGNGACTASRVKVEAFNVVSGTSGIAVQQSPRHESTAAYNLSGQRVGAAHKGLVISGGKKYFAK